MFLTVAYKLAFALKMVHLFSCRVKNSLFITHLVAILKYRWTYRLCAELRASLLFNNFSTQWQD